MSASDNGLETEATEARAELAFNRSNYPSICANLLQKSIKNDIKISTTFIVNSGNSSTFWTKYENEEALEKIYIRRNAGVSFEKMKDLQDQMNRASAALDIISRNKSNNQ